MARNRCSYCPTFTKFAAPPPIHKKLDKNQRKPKLNPPTWQQDTTANWQSHLISSAQNPRPPTQSQRSRPPQRRNRDGQLVPQSHPPQPSESPTDDAMDDDAQSSTSTRQSKQNSTTRWQETHPANENWTEPAQNQGTTR